MAPALKSLIEQNGERSDFGERDRRTHVYRYVGVATSPDIRGPQIELDSLMPQRGQKDQHDPRCTVLDVRCEKQKRSLDTWDIEVLTTNALQLDDEENPLTKAAEVTWSGNEFEGRTKFDIQGRPILNTAYDLVPVPVRLAVGIIRIATNVAHPPPDLKIKFRNTVNRSSVSVDGILFKKKTLFAAVVDVLPEVTTLFAGRQIRYRPVQAQLEYLEQTWAAEYPNVGFNQLLRAAQQVPLRDRNNPHKFVKDKDGKVSYVGGDNQKLDVKVPIRIGFPEEPPTEPQVLDRRGFHVARPGPNDLITFRADVQQESNFNTLVGILRAH